ncbi:hypothetical protein ACTXT7_009190 [Hymenolepis weldensis]
MLKAFITDINRNNILSAHSVVQETPLLYWKMLQQNLVESLFVADWGHQLQQVRLVLKDVELQKERGQKMVREELCSNDKLQRYKKDCKCKRQVEDHEFAMDLQRRWPAAVAASRIWFRHNRKKYSFNKDLDRILSLKDATLRGDMIYSNILFLGVSEGVVMLKRPHGKWSKVFCFLVMSTIFFTKRHFGYLLHNSLLDINFRSKKKSKYLLDLTTMDVYIPQEKTNVIKLLHTPTPHTLLLVPSSIGLLDPEAIFAIGCKTRQSMLAWAEGLRFHKYGQRKLSENLENALNHRFSPQVEATKQNGSPINERTIESVIDQIITPVNRSVVNKESSRSNENGNRSGTMNPRAFNFNTETLRLYKQNRSPHQYFFENDYQSRNENSTTLRRWSAYDSEDNEGYFNNNGNVKTDMNSSVSTLKSSSETQSFTQNTNGGHSFLQQELTNRFSVYEPENRFEGVVFQSGAPYLLLELPDGLHKYSIEV